jgi:hypothetical protein
MTLTRLHICRLYSGRRGRGPVLWAYQFWKFKKHVTGYSIEHETKPLVYEVHRDDPGYSYRRFTLIVK